jgi:alpha-tubulin suppressor-like RCC1 family protein
MKSTLRTKIFLIGLAATFGITGYSQEPGTLKWRYPVGGASSAALSPDGNTIYIGSTNNNIYALNTDGTLKWSYPTLGQVWARPCVAPDGTIYVGSLDTMLYALNPNGTLKWTFTDIWTFDSIYPGATLASDGTIYYGSDDLLMHAVNPNGTLKWSVQANSEFRGPPAVATDGTVYFDDTEAIYSFNPDGSLRWTHTAVGVPNGPAVGSDGTVYIGGDNVLLALNTNGTVKWSYSVITVSSTMNTPAVGADNTVYISPGYGVFAVTNGVQKWFHGTGDNWMSGPALRNDGLVYVGDNNGILWAFKDGHNMWTYGTGSSIYSTPTIGPDDTVYFQSYDGYTYALYGGYFTNTFSLNAGQLSGGNLHTAALKKDGTVWTWGDNAFGQLGNNSTIDSHFPVQVLTGVTAVACGGQHTLALKSNGTVLAWGNNNNGQIGDNSTTTRKIPVAVSGLSGVVAISAGFLSSYAVKSDGTVWAWGDNSNGQLGDGTTTDRHIPVQVSTVTGITNIAAGDFHALALKSDNTVWAWGDNQYGQVGNGSSGSDALIPAQVGSLSSVRTVAAGGYHSLAIKTDGTLWAWGRNTAGQLGNNTTTQSTTPIQSLVTNVIGIAAGTNSSYALSTNLTVWAWGQNDKGQLGDNTTTERHVPVFTGATNTAIVAAGSRFGLVGTFDSIVAGFGDNSNGELGDNTITDRHVPALTHSFAFSPLIDIDFSNGSTSLKHGQAGIGQGTNDFWNLCRGTNFINTPFTIGTANLKHADGTATTVGINASFPAGQWAFGNGSSDPMYNAVLASLTTSPITLTVTNLPTGSYDFYVYSQSAVDQLSVGANTYGPLNSIDSVSNPPFWDNGRQYVTFHKIPVTAGQSVTITVGLVSGNSNCYLSGLQILPN